MEGNKCYTFCNQLFDVVSSERIFCKKGCDSEEENMWSK